MLVTAGVPILMALVASGVGLKRHSEVAQISKSLLEGVVQTQLIHLPLQRLPQRLPQLPPPKLQLQHNSPPEAAALQEHGLAKPPWTSGVSQTAPLVGLILKMIVLPIITIRPALFSCVREKILVWVQKMTI